MNDYPVKILFQKQDMIANDACSERSGRFWVCEQKGVKERMRGRSQKVLVLLLTAAMTLTLVTPAFAEEHVISEASPKDNIDKPDSFEWSGGTGRLKGITCEKLTVKNGETWAAITFASGSVEKVKVDEEEYPRIDGTSDTSVFEIPVELNKTMTISGMTTAMSQPHWVDYQIYVGVKAAAKQDEKHTGDLGELEIQEDVPGLTGVDYVGSLKLDYAENFNLHYYADDFRVLEIDVWKNTSRTDLDEADAKEGAAPAEQADLYGGAGICYLLAPEDAELPIGVEKEMLIVRLPVEKAYVASDVALEILEKLEAVERIGAVAKEKEDCRQEDIKKGLEDERMIYAGSYEEPLFKELVMAEADLAIVPEAILPHENDAAEDAREEGTEKDAAAEDARAAGAEASAAAEKIEDMKALGEKFAMLDIPMIIDRSVDEKEALGKYEWIKVYGALFGCEKKAAEVYEAAEKALAEKNGTAVGRETEK